MLIRVSQQLLVFGLLPRFVRGHLSAASDEVDHAATTPVGKDNPALKEVHDAAIREAHKEARGERLSPCRALFVDQMLIEMPIGPPEL